MATVASWGDLVFTNPVNNAEAINYFGISLEVNGPVKTVEKWNYTGQKGDFIKRLFTTGQSATLTGFIDAAAIGTIQTAVDTIAEIVDDGTAFDLTQEGNTVLADALLTSVAWGSATGQAGRYQKTFKMSFESAL